MAGRPPTPTAILELRGSRQAAGRAGEARFDRKPPACPKCLQGEARKEWKRLVKQLSDAGVLQNTDAGILAAYCQSLAEFHEASDQLAKTGLLTSKPSGEIVRNPLIGIKNHAADRVNKYGQQLGLTPSARSRVPVDLPAAQEQGVVSRRRA